MSQWIDPHNICSDNIAVDWSLVELMFSIAPDDFLLPTTQLTFNPGNGLQRDCATITVGSDTILEDDESFSVVLTTTDPDVTINPNTTVVTLTNDDSKYPCLTSLVVKIAGGSQRCERLQTQEIDTPAHYQYLLLLHSCRFTNSWL